MLRALTAFAFAWTLLIGCGSATKGSKTQNFLTSGGWRLEDSPYMLRPGKSIMVCDTGVKEGVAALVVNAVRVWLQAGGRDERLEVGLACTGDRVIELQAVDDTVTYYGRANRLVGNTFVINVPPRWARHLTANHEVGHVFGFAHNFDVISVMNSKERGRFMNDGAPSDYDLAEVRRLLADETFVYANAAWEYTPAVTEAAAAN